MVFTVYGTPASPFVRKVRTVLAEKQVEYTLNQVNVFDPPKWFLDISPMRRIPVLRHQGDGFDRTLADSSAICGYLEKLFPDPALYPKDPYDFGRALWIEEYADTGMAAQIGFNIFRPRIGMKTTDPEELAKVEGTIANKLPRYFDYLEGEIGAAGYFAGPDFSIADIAVTTQLVSLYHCAVDIDPARWPHLARFTDQMFARPSFAALLDEERPLYSLRHRQG